MSLLPAAVSRREAPALPPVIGHRGAAARAPENTLAGFRCARALGCEWVEFDVRLTADGAPVLCHDDRLDRTTDGKGRVAAQTLSAVRQYDAGARFGAAFAREPVPTLDDALAVCIELGLGANIEIKSERGLAARTAAAVATTLARFGRAAQPILVSSFAVAALAAIRELAPRVPRGLLIRLLTRDWGGSAERLGCATVNFDHRRLSASLVDAIRSSGYPVLAYTVNDPARARQLFDWGVTSVFSDVPDIILATISAHKTVGPAPADGCGAMSTGQGAFR